MGWSKQAKTLAANYGVRGMKKGIRKPKPLAKGKSKSAIHPKIAQIAKEHLGVDTLERRGMDSQDFHDQATWTLTKAMHAAYAHGAKDPNAKLSDDEIEEMGKKHLGRETMKTRKSDSLDFQQESVGGMHAVLSDAMQRGKASRKKGVTKNSSFKPRGKVK